MYLDFFELKYKPFTIKTDGNALYLSQQYMTAFTLLQYGIENCDGFTVITGEVGCGKTTLCNALMRELSPEEYQVISLTIPPQSEHELLEAICLQIGITFRSTENSLEKLRNKIVDKLRTDLNKGRKTILFLDEAQNLSIENLEKVRLLSNLERDDEKLIHIILVGQPELQKNLRKSCLRQLRQRISVYHNLKPLNFHETKNYIEHRILKAKLPPKKEYTLRTKIVPSFSFFALRKIYAASKGIPRVVNNICDKALISAFIDYSQKVRLKDVRRALKDIKQLKSL